MGNTGSVNFVSSLELSPDPVHTCPEYDLFDASNGYKKLSLFVFKATASADQELITFQKWKQLRHPFILQYLDSGVHKGRKCLLTEHVTPISLLLEQTGPRRIETHEELIAGFNDILEAIKFLHETCDYSHNHISLEWIFSSSKSYGTWKLGGLHLLSKKSDETADFARRLIAYKKANLPSSMSLLASCDSSVSSIEPLSKQPFVHKRDSYAIGKLMSKLFKKSSSVDPFASFFVGKDSLPKIGDILKSDLFSKCSYLQLKKSLASFATLSENEKQQLILSLPVMLQNISEFLLSSRVIPMLLASRLIMLHPTAKKALHAHLLVPEGKSHPAVEKWLISCVNFEIYVIPVILKMFMVKRISLRLILLNYLEYYGHLIPDNSIDKIILPQVKIGMKDINDDIVVASYRAIATLVSIFGGDSIIGAKERKKHFHCDVPRLQDKESTCVLSNVYDHSGSGSDGKNNWLSNCANDESKQFAHISIDHRSEPDGGEFTGSSMKSRTMKGEPWSDQWDATSTSEDPSHYGDDASSGDVQSNVNTPSAINVSFSSSSNTFFPPNNEDVEERPNNFITKPNPCSENVVTASTKENKNITNCDLAPSNDPANRSKSKASELSKITSFDVKEIDIKLSDEIDDLFSQMEPSIDFKIAHMPSSVTSSKSTLDSVVKMAHVKDVEKAAAALFNQSFEDAPASPILPSVIPSSLFAVNLSHELSDQNNQGDWSNDEWEGEEEDYSPSNSDLPLPLTLVDSIASNKASEIEYSSSSSSPQPLQLPLVTDTSVIKDDVTSDEGDKLQQIVR